MMDGATNGFRALYAGFWPQLEPLLLSQPGLSPPLLLSPSDRYEQQRTRLFVIGQETCTWYNDRLCEKRGDEAIDALMTIYRDEFRLGLARPTVFWQAVRDLERRLGIEAGAVLWSNLNKADENAGPPSPQVEAQLLQLFPVLEQEVVLANPDVVIFFTGPRYDRLIESIFRGVRFGVAGLPQRVLTRVVHEMLPERTFRTYHPSYLRRRKLTSTVLSHIMNLCGAVPVGKSSNSPAQPTGCIGG